MANEKRLIDANALINHMKDLPTRYEDGGGSWLCLDGYPKGMFDPEDVISSIENAPTVDAVEVVHGQRLYNAHEVAEIIADILGDPCACNFNSIDEWLPFKCELQAACPNPVGVACWEQYLKYRDAKMDGERKDNE